MFKKNTYSLKEQSLFLFAGKILSLGMQIITPMVLVRIFNKNDYGFYQNINLIISFIGSIISWNLATSLYYFYNRVENKETLISQTIILQILISLIFVISYFFFNKIILDFFQIAPERSIIWIIGLCSIFFINTEIFESILIVDKQSRYVLIFLVASGFFRFILICITAIIFKDIYKVLLALLAFFALQTIAMVLYLSLRYKINFSIIDRHNLLEQFRYIMPLGLSKIVGEIGNKIDKLVFAHYFSKMDYALYSVATFRLPFVNLIFPAIGNVIIPQVSVMAKNNDYNGARMLWHKMINMFAIITIPFTVFSFFTSKELIVLLYTTKYLDAVPVYQLILLTFLVQIFARGTIISAFGKTSYFLKIQILSTFVGAVLSYVLIRRFGMWGAAITGLSVFYLSGILQVVMSKHILCLTFKQWLPWKKLVIITAVSLIASIIIIPIKIVLDSNILILFIAFILYFLILVLIFTWIGLVKINFNYNNLKSTRIDFKL